MKKRSMKQWKHFNKVAGMTQPTIFLQIIKADEVYSNINVKGKNPLYTIAREYGLSPNANLLSGRWVLRVDGVYRDHNQYRVDLAQHNGAELESDTDYALRTKPIDNTIV